MQQDFRVLALNPGSTSTKIAVFDGDSPLFTETVRHPREEIAQFGHYSEQFDYRKDAVERILTEKGIELSSIDAVVARGGLIKPIPGGTYIVNEQMIKDLKHGVQGDHPANLGGQIAQEIADDAGGIPAFTVDPPVVDEMEPIAKISGTPLITRRPIYQPLNQRAVARRFAAETHHKYEDLNLIITHLGGGISTGIHYHGRVIDANNAVDGEGPLMPERAGTLPALDLVKLCFSGKYTYKDIKEMIIGNGGLMGYLGTNDLVEVKEMIANGDAYAALIYEAMIYQIAKEIGAAATVLKGKVDAIILSGGIAYDSDLVAKLEERICFIAPVAVYPGEDELLALTAGTLRVLRGEEKAKTYA